MRNCLAVLAALLVGCGDNSRSCGPATREENGFCVPTATCGFGTKPDVDSGACVPDGAAVCSAGTVFDPVTGLCVIDPAACQNGTVLIDGACVDATVGIVADLQEGPEPNGLGILEASLAQAGNVNLKVIGGSAFVVHGTIDPHSDADGVSGLDPDVDTYIVTITGPTLLSVQADGVHGVTAGFLFVAAVGAEDPLVDWRRFGINLDGDASRRQVYLPKAGSYRLAVADTRTLFEYLVTGAATSAPGGDDGDYYLSVANVALPAPTPLTATAGGAAASGAVADDAIAFYSAPLGTGLNTVTLATPSAFAVGSVVVVSDNVFRGTADETTTAARMPIGEVAPAATTLIAVDHVYNVSPAPVDFSLDVTTSDATALSMTGGTVTATASTNVGTNFSALNLFSFEVTADDATLAMVLAFNPPIVGQVYDGAGQRVAAFTSPSTTTTWSDYQGAIRLHRPGRYYFAVYAPSATSTTTLAVTSSITEVAELPVTAATPLTAPIGPADLGVFSYTPANAWELFDVTGANTGGQVGSWFAPSTAYGRLDALVSSAGTLPSEVAPLYTHAFPTTGDPVGRIALGEAAYYVKVRATNPTAAPTATLSFTTRPDVTDLGALAPGVTTLAAETLSPTSPQRFYLFRGGGGRTITLTTTPTSNVNTQFWRLARDESPAGPQINDNNGPDVETFVQLGSDWSAFVVSAAGNLNGARTFDVTVSIQ